MRSGRAVVTDGFGDPRGGNDDDDAAFTGGLVAPMLWSGSVQGVLGVGTKHERGFTREEADLLEAYAGLASLALANAQAFSARSRQARVQRGFFRIAAVLGQSLSLAATLEAVAQAANETLGGTFAAVLMPRGAQLELAASAGLPEELTKGLEEGLPESADCLRVAAAEGRLLASPAVSRDDRFETPWRELSAAFRLPGAARSAGREPARGTIGSRARVLRRRACIRRRRPGARASSRRRSARRARAQRAVRSGAHCSCALAAARAHRWCAGDRARPGGRARGSCPTGAETAERTGMCGAHARGRRARRQRSGGQRRGGSGRDAQLCERVALR